MAIYPKDMYLRETLQPGADGSKFQVNMPGYRNEEDRINRTQNRFNAGRHDVPNIKYELDKRLKVLFRYGYAFGYNQMVIPKGRVVAVDPFMNHIDFDVQKKYNVITLANGGVPVKLREDGDVYGKTTGAAAKPTDIISEDKQEQQLPNVGSEWTPIEKGGYTERTLRGFYVGDTTKAFKGPVAQLGEYKVDPATGAVVDAQGIEQDVRPANVPIGILEKNQYTTDEDALNGMMPGPIRTDALVELPWFSHKDKAEEMVWGSAYGPFAPGMLVKSDENGRVIPSPLAFEEEMADMSVAELELERQQVIGQIYEVNTEMVPAGSTKWVTWALEDRLKFEDFNPKVWPDTNRRGEDSVSMTPYKSTGKYPGYPYDKAYKDHDLHMLGGGARQGNYDMRMQQEYQYADLGIPGLTDGKNVASRQYGPINVGTIYKAEDEYQEIILRIPEVDVEDVKITVGSEAAEDAVVGAALFGGGLVIKYFNAKQGIFILEVKKSEFETKLASETSVDVKVEYSKRGMSGVPTFMDWDGVVGSVKVLLQK